MFIIINVKIVYVWSAVSHDYVLFRLTRVLFVCGAPVTGSCVCRINMLAATNWVASL
jgi:hypothetical protein